MTFSKTKFSIDSEKEALSKISASINAIKKIKDTKSITTNKPITRLLAT